MLLANAVVISGAVEGMIDEAVLTRLVDEAGGQVRPIYGKNGKPHLRRVLGGYNNAARFSPWLVLVDLDQDAECAPPLVAAWLPAPAPRMRLRVAVRAIEAWLLADRERLAGFLRVSAARLMEFAATVWRPEVAAGCSDSLRRCRDRIAELVRGLERS